uniref:Tripartite motif-containing protein 16-like n=1 Tax=Erpetoichthys calabaricus TaxID=27687 RepID=A0A8C4RET0_ERPCA
MAEARLFGFQDAFACSVCLKTLTDPVSLNCGHSFCLKCLTNCWDQSHVCSCPQCRHVFILRPELHINMLLNEVIEKLKKTELSPPSTQNLTGPGDVECDACCGKKFRAVKSCLTCMASFCQTHIQPHYKDAARKGHKLTDPDKSLKEKLCAKHHRSLEVFCKTDEMCLCKMCMVAGHKGHKVVELKTEGKKKQVSGMKMAKRIRELKKRDVEKTEGVMERLQKKIEELKSKDAELKEEFMQVRDKNMILQHHDESSFLHANNTFSLYLHCVSSPAPGLVSAAPDWSLSIACIMLRPQSQISSLVIFSLLSDFCPLTLDINTAHRVLRLSEGNKKVRCEKTKTKYPNHPDRFDWWEQVLCKEALTGTRCYWEVEWSGDVMAMGVTYKGLSRKGNGDECRLGYNDKSWTLVCSQSWSFVCHSSMMTLIKAPHSPRIGVYLDWPAGSLSFYSVSQTMTLLHTFNTSFTEPLYPGFWLARNPSVTICHLTSCDH